MAVDAYTPLVCKHYLPMRHPVSQISILETQFQISKTPKIILLNAKTGYSQHNLTDNHDIFIKNFNNNRPRPILKLDFRKFSSRDSFLNSFRVFFQHISQESITKGHFPSAFAFKNNYNGENSNILLHFRQFLRILAPRQGKIRSVDLN